MQERPDATEPLLDVLNAALAVVVLIGLVNLAVTTISL